MSIFFRSLTGMGSPRPPSTPVKEVDISKASFLPVTLKVDPERPPKVLISREGEYMPTFEDRKAKLARNSKQS